MKFVELLDRLLPGAETWDEESLAEARVCLEKAGPIFSDLLDEDGADSSAPPTATTPPTEPAAPVSTEPAPVATGEPVPMTAEEAAPETPAGEAPAAPATP